VLDATKLILSERPLAVADGEYINYISFSFWGRIKVGFFPHHIILLYKYGNENSKTISQI